MKPVARKDAIKDLSQKNDDELFNTVAKGIGLVWENALTLRGDARALYDSHRFRGATILWFLAQEEAAKILVLLDAIRCGRTTKWREARFTKHLGCFQNHVAKGIYVKYTSIRPANFAEVEEFVTSQRQAFYSDWAEEYGFWSCRNDIERFREQSMYVSYERFDSGDPGWTSPDLSKEILEIFCDPDHDFIFGLIESLLTIGLNTPAGLKTLAELWTDFEVTDKDIFEVEQMNVKLLERLNVECLEAPRWLFPLYPLDLTMTHP